MGNSVSDLTTWCTGRLPRWVSPANNRPASSSLGQQTVNSKWSKLNDKEYMPEVYFSVISNLFLLENWNNFVIFCGSDVETSLLGRADRLSVLLD